MCREFETKAQEQEDLSDVREKFLSYIRFLLNLQLDSTIRTQFEAALRQYFQDLSDSLKPTTNQLNLKCENFADYGTLKDECKKIESAIKLNPSSPPDLWLFETLTRSYLADYKTSQTAKFTTLKAALDHVKTALNIPTMKLVKMESKEFEDYQDSMAELLTGVTLPEGID